MLPGKVRKISVAFVSVVQVEYNTLHLMSYMSRSRYAEDRWVLQSTATQVKQMSIIELDIIYIGTRSSALTERDSHPKIIEYRLSKKDRIYIQ